MRAGRLASRSAPPHIGVVAGRDSQLSLFGGSSEPTPERRPGGAGAARGAGHAGAEVPGEVGAAAPSAELRQLASRLPPGLHLGTSSWSFPGWAGLVWDRKATTRTLARKGLAAYAEFPLFQAVGLDRTYYEPLTVGELQPYAHAVADGFGFVVKAPELCTVARFGKRGRWAERAGSRNELFLDPLFALRRFVEPTIEGLGDKLGAIVFQFPPQGLARWIDRLIDKLAAFLAELPEGPVYAVEFREPAAWDPPFLDMLEHAGAVPCFSVHPSLPPLDEQVRRAGSRRRRATVARWNLHSGFRYEEARARYEPFDRLVDPDTASRAAIASLCVADARQGRASWVTANNKAEGSAPRTIIEAARAVAELLEAPGAAEDR